MQRLLVCCLVCACFVSMVWGAPPQVLYDQLRKDVEFLRTAVKRDDAEKLHTPTDVEMDCLYTAFSCFINATVFLKPIEQPTENKKFNETLSIIQSVPHHIYSASEEKCPRCTDYPKQSPIHFLDKFRRLLQQLYRISPRS